VGSEKTRRRANHDGESEPKSVPDRRCRPGDAGRGRRYNVANGAQIIDINMGCPAKKGA